MLVRAAPLVPWLWMVTPDWLRMPVGSAPAPDPRSAGPVELQRKRLGERVLDGEDVAAHLAPYLELGFHHMIAACPSPYDEESLTRLAREVRPQLEKALVTAV